MTLIEIAKRINAHLQRFETTPEIKEYTYIDRAGAERTNSRYWSAGAYRAGRYVNVVYVSYQGRHSLTKDEALAYLAWLDAGNVGRHFEQQREAAGNP